MNGSAHAQTYRVYYLLDAGQPLDRPLARFTDAPAAREAIAALEHLGRAVRLLSRDESRNRPRPSLWTVEYATPPRAAPATRRRSESPGYWPASRAVLHERRALRERKALR